MTPPPVRRPPTTFGNSKPTGTGQAARSAARRPPGRGGRARRGPPTPPATQLVWTNHKHTGVLAYGCAGGVLSAATDPATVLLGSPPHFFLREVRMYFLTTLFKGLASTCHTRGPCRSDPRRLRVSLVGLRHCGLGHPFLNRRHCRYTRRLVPSFLCSWRLSASPFIPPPLHSIQRVLANLGLSPVPSLLCSSCPGLGS